MKDSLDSTQLLPVPTWEQPRVHLLDDFWLLTLLVTMVCAALSWVSGAFDIDVVRVSWGLLGLAALHVVFTLLGAPARHPRRGRTSALALLDLAGVVLTGFVWLNLGALQDPVLLLVFALPVIGAVFLSRWYPFLIALAAIAFVTAVALLQAHELRWYITGLLGHDVWLGWLHLPQHGGATTTLEHGNVPLSYELLMLEVFAVIMCACAIAAEYLAGLFERLQAQVIVARGEAERGQELWMELIQRLPLPAMLIEPNTLTVLTASQQALALLQADPEALRGRPLFDTLQMSYPDMLQELLSGIDGELPIVIIRVGHQLKLTRARVLHVTHKTRRLALLTLQDETETFCLQAALDTSEYAALVIDARGAVLAFNKPAVGLFGALEVGAAATRLMPLDEGVPPWWQSGMGERRKLHLEIASRAYQVTSTALTLRGEEERIYCVSLLPAARALDATDSTRILRFSGQRP